MTKAIIGNTVSVHYNGTFNDGTEFDSSYTRGEPITFEVGAGQMISGFDAAIPGMIVGESKNISISSGDAYGERNDESVQSVPLTTFPEDFDLTEGSMIRGQHPNGQAFMAKIVSHDDTEVMLDLNHPLAGKDLNFKIELVDIS
jgi:peptidylprolyl isomerase